MAYILGLDPSLKKTGYVILDTDKSDKIVEEKGLLKTSSIDGILVQRLIKQIYQIDHLIKKYAITFVGMEAPFFGASNTEILFALNQFIHRLFFDRNIYVICFPPQMLKKLVFPDRNVSEIYKPHMIDKAKTALNMHGKILAEDIADAYWAGIFGKRFYKWHIKKLLSDEDLGNYELKTYKGEHTYTRGIHKGETIYQGIIYRENELFFDFKAIKKRTKNISQKKHRKKRFK